MTINPFMYGPGYGHRPLNDTTPFTFRDSYTFLQKLDEFLKTINTVENRELEFIKTVETAVADGKQAADAFMAEMVDKYQDILGQLIGYTIVVDEHTYRASMMDGSVFESYTISGVDNQLTIQTAALNVKLDEHKVEVGLAVNAINDAINKMSDGWVNVKEYGAIGDGLTPEYEAFRQACSGGNKTVYVPAGEYRINHYIQLEANTVIEMHPDAVLVNESNIEYVFLNGEYGNGGFSSAYIGPGNITIRGGVFDGRIKVAQFRSSCFVGISHAENVLIENCTFRNGYSSHLVEINSSRNVTIRNCTFDTLNPAGLDNREFINIDYSFGTGYPAHGSYDGTVCSNVTIENCSFNGGSDGVGTHSPPTNGGQHTNIRVLNNHFTNMSVYPITPRYWKDSIISGNVIEGGICAVRLSPSEGVLVSNNIITGSGDSLNSAIWVNDSPGTVLSKNVIIPDPADPYTEAIVIGGSSKNCVVDIDTVSEGSRDGKIRVYQSAYPIQIGNTLSVVATRGTAVKMKFPGSSRQGVVIIASRSASRNSPRGMYWIRCGSADAVITPIGTVAEQDNVILGVGVPSVATVPSDKFGVFVDVDGYYLFNNSDLDRVVDVSMSGGW